MGSLLLFYQIFLCLKKQFYSPPSFPCCSKFHCLVFRWICLFSLLWTQIRSLIESAGLFSGGNRISHQLRLLYICHCVVFSYLLLELPPGLSEPLSLSSGSLSFPDPFPNPFLINSSAIVWAAQLYLFFCSICCLTVLTLLFYLLQWLREILLLIDVHIHVSIHVFNRNLLIIYWHHTLCWGVTIPFTWSHKMDQSSLNIFIILIQSKKKMWSLIM